MKKKMTIAICASFLISGLTAMYIYNNSSKTNTSQNQKKQYTETNVIAIGNVEPLYSEKIYFDNPVMVKQVLAGKLQKVTKGQKIMEIVTQDINIQLDQARSTLQNQQSINNNNNNNNNMENTKQRISYLENLLTELTQKTLSPSDGIISQISATAGTYINSSQLAYEIINPNKIQIRTRTIEANHNVIKPDQEVIITSNSPTKDAKIKGKVERTFQAATNPGSNGQEKIFEIIISADKTAENSQKLLSGMNVNCEILTQNPQSKV